MFNFLSSSCEKVAFTIGNFEVAWYSIYILVGVLLASVLFLLEAKKYEMDMDFCINMIFWTVIFGIIGARLYYVLFNLNYYMDNPSEIRAAIKKIDENYEEYSRKACEFYESCDVKKIIERIVEHANLREVIMMGS